MDIVWLLMNIHKKLSVWIVNASLCILAVINLRVFCFCFDRVTVLFIHSFHHKQSGNHLLTLLLFYLIHSCRISHSLNFLICCLSVKPVYHPAMPPRPARFSRSTKAAKPAAVEAEQQQEQQQQQHGQCASQHHRQHSRTCSVEVVITPSKKRKVVPASNESDHVDAKSCEQKEAN